MADTGLQEFKLPEFLIRRMREGRVILFLGAGASIGSRNAEGTSPPLGSDLAKLLSAAAAIQYDGEDLATVAANAKRQLGDAEYWRILKRSYQHCKPSEAYRIITRYYWSRIYTTNIDDALEEGFRSHKLQQFEVLVHSSPLRIDIGRDDVIQYIKLNGSIDRLESSLIFTPEEYLQMQGRENTWYSEVARDFLEHTFVFIGTKLAEPLFHWHVNRLKTASRQSNGRSYIICPGFTEHTRLNLRENNIEAIEGSIDDFARALAASLGPKLGASDVSAAQHPALYELFNSDLKTRFGSCKSELDSITLVNRNQLEGAFPKEKAAIRRFYFGTEPSWRDILDGVPAKLSFLDEVITALERGDKTILVQGSAGSGKTTLLMMAALEHARAHPERLVLWIHKNGPFPTNVLREICAHFRDKVSVFVDDFAPSSDVISEFVVPRGKYDAPFVLSERTNILHRAETDFQFQAEVKISRLRESDVNPLLEKLEAFGPWHRLSKMTPKERRDSIMRVADKQLLVGLREATSGTGYDQIMRDEYKKIPDGYPRRAALLVALASSRNVSISKKTLLSALSHLGSDQLPSQLDDGLQDIVFITDGYVRFRHSLIADFLVSNVIDKEQCLRGIRALLFSLSRFESPIRQNARGPESRLFVALTNHEFLWSLFRERKENALSLYREFEQYFARDALYWLHYALFEQKCGVRYLSDAMNHIRLALDMYAKSHQINNAFANIHFSAAVEANKAEAALALMEDATAIMEEQCKDPETEAYALVGLCTGRLKVFRRWLPNKLDEEWKVLRKRLLDAKYKYQDNHEIVRALHSIPLEIIARPVGSSSSRGRRRRRGSASMPPVR